MDTSLDKIYAEILAIPEDDALRIRYADLAGGDRAELIRQGIALRDLRRKRLYGRYVVPTLEKIASLLRKHPEWGADVLPLVSWLEYGRGFVERVSLPAAAFLQRASVLYAKAPLLHAKLTQATGHIEALAASPHIARLRSLDLSENRLVDRDAITLASSPHLARLRWLDLSKNRIGDSGVDALAAATPQRLPELRYLDLMINECQDPSEEPIEDDTGRITFQNRPEGARLEKKYGSLQWLHHRTETPPEPETFY